MFLSFFRLAALESTAGGIIVIGGYTQGITAFSTCVSEMTWASEMTLCMIGTVYIGVNVLGGSLFLEILGE